jgi:predicted DCC family thiol-disulfide oxidoreductase YuxK
MTSGAMPEPEIPSAIAHPIVLYDGVCGLCNRSVQFILNRDPQGIFRFASLQSAVAERILARHGAHATDLDTMYVALNCDPADGEVSSKEILLSRSDAALFVLEGVGGAWRVIGEAIRLLPRIVRDFGYRVIASNHYRIFGQYDACPIPTEATRSRFLDV